MEIPTDREIELMDIILRFECMPYSSGRTKFYDKYIKPIGSSEEQRINGLIAKFIYEEDIDIGISTSAGRHYSCDNKTIRFNESGGFANYYAQVRVEIERQEEVETLTMKKLRQEVSINENLIDYYNTRKNRRFWTITISTILSVSASITSGIVIDQLHSQPDKNKSIENNKTEPISSPKKNDLDSLDLER